jgi:hypothetical protein
MTDDIVTRLRDNTCFGIVDPLSAEAADEIKRLRRELAMIKMVRLSEDAGLYD